MDSAGFDEDSGLWSARFGFWGVVCRLRLIRLMDLVALAVSGQSDGDCDCEGDGMFHAATVRSGGQIPAKKPAHNVKESSKTVVEGRFCLVG